jgi:hypothetical protein
MYHSYDQWKNKGRQVKLGEVSSKTSSTGEVLFSKEQTKKIKVRKPKNSKVFAGSKFTGFKNIC